MALALWQKPIRGLAERVFRLRRIFFRLLRMLPQWPFPALRQQVEKIHFCASRRRARTGFAPVSP